MAKSSENIIELICPTLFNDSNLSDWLAYAQECVDRCFFGGDYNKAVAYMACHMFSLAGSRPSGESGVITSKKEGDLAISFGGIPGDDELDLTYFGQQYKRLRKGTRAGITVLGTPTNMTINCGD